MVKNGTANDFMSAFPNSKIKAQILRDEEVGRISSKAVELIGGFMMHLHSKILIAFHILGATHTFCTDFI